MEINLGVIKQKQPATGNGADIEVADKESSMTLQLCRKTKGNPLLVDAAEIIAGALRKWLWI